MAKKHGEVITQYCEKYPTTPSRTLARLILKENPKLGKTLEQIRSTIRNRRNANGSTNRNQSAMYYPRFANPTNDEIITPAKVLVFDIETSPILAWIWSIWQKRVPLSMVQNDLFMLSWSAKWLFDDNIISDGLKPSEIKKQNDHRITKSLWKLIDQADILIAHNGVKFDIPFMQTRFVHHNMTSPSSYQVIDTLKTCRRQFKFTSNKLDFICEKLGIGKKLEHDGFDLWKRVMAGDKEAMIDMITYCNQDVELLEELYFTIRSYVKPHPNMGLFFGDGLEHCPSCGSTELKDEGEYRTYINAYQAKKCGNCGSWSRDRKTLTPLRDFPNFKSSLPR